MESEQLKRIFAIMRILMRNRFPASLDDIREALSDEDVKVPSKRTLFRDMEKLQSLGYTVSSKRGEGYLLQNRSKVASEVFTDEMVQALQMSRSVFDYFKGTIFRETIDESLSIITGATREDLTHGRFSELENNFMVHLGPHRNFIEKRDILDEIISSVNGNYRIEIEYKKPGDEGSSVVVDPYRILLYKDSLYLIARKGKERKLRTYQVTRISSAEQCAESFKRVDSIIEEYEERLNSSFGIMTYGEKESITLTLSADVAEAVQERTWHDSQRVRLHEDGTIKLTMEVLINHELVGWILSWGRRVLEVKPESLEKMVEEERGQ